MRHTTPSFEGDEGTRIGEMVCESSMLQRFMIHPHGMKRLIFVAFGMFFLALDAITMPLQVFDLGELVNILFTLSQITAVYWALDVIFQCFLGFQTHDGSVEMRPSRVRANYFRGSFPADLAIVVVDFSTLIWEMLDPDIGSNAIKVGTRGFRFARLMRLVRLFRAKRLGEMTDCILNRLKSEHMVLGMKLAKHVVLLLLANHYICCGWYFIATLDDEVTWITTFAGEGASPSTIYAMSLHWALTQFSPSTQNIAPTNLRERIFASCIVLFALLAFSSFVSSITNAVNQLRTINMGKLLEEARIREFLHLRDVSTKLVGNVQQFFNQNYQAQKKRVHETDIRFFAEVPESLRIQLHEELYRPWLLDHALFRIIHMCDRALVRKICHLAMQERAVLPRQDLFIDGTEAESTCFITGGCLMYDIIRQDVEMSDNLSGEQNALERIRVSPRSCVAEMALWVRWIHRGHLFALDFSEVISMQAAKFGLIVSQSECQMSEVVRSFAILLTARMETTGTTLSDLPIEHDVIVELIQRALGFLKLQVFRKRGNHKSNSTPELSELLGGSKEDVASVLYKPIDGLIGRVSRRMSSVESWRFLHQVRRAFSMGA